MVTSYGFDGANAETFVYTANDERIGVLRNPDWTWSLRDGGGKVLRQYRSSSTTPSASWLWIEDFVYRDGLLLGSQRVAEEGGRRQYHLDHLGSPRLVTGASGSVISEHDFLPFGEERTPIGQHQARGFDREEPLRFTGHERDFDNVQPNDSSSYIDDMHARYYVTKTGRFLSVDSGGAESIRLQMPQTWNRYTYALNNSVRYADPTGRLVECVPNPEEGKPPICAEVIEIEGEAPPVEPQPTTPSPLGPIRRIEPITPLPAKYQVAAALGVMWGNYQEMRDRNLRGADRYYHCMAHCAAPLMGPAGTATSHVVGVGREAIDFWANIYHPRKQMDLGSSWKDCSADMAANAHGRARNGQATCREQCKSLAPAGVNP